MLRAAALLLLVANLLLLGARHGWLGKGGADAAAEREPQRLARQVNPERVQVVPAEAASGAGAAGTVGSAAPAACLEAGPFSGAEAAAAERTVREAGLPDGSWQLFATEDKGGFMVYMGRYADRDAVLRKIEELKRRQVTASVLPDSADLRPGLDLGRYPDRAAADAALAALNQRGVRTARVVALRAGPRVVRFKLPQADAAVRARLAGLKLPSGPGFVACTAEAAGHPSAAPVPAAAVAPAASNAASTAAPAVRAAATPVTRPVASVAAPALASAGPAAPASPASGASR